MSNKKNSDLFSLQSEKHSLSSICRNKEVLYEIDGWFTSTDYSQDIHATIYAIVRQVILAKEHLDPVLVAQKIANLGIKFNQDISIFDYVQSLFLIPTTKDVGIESFKDVLKLRIRRNLVDGAREIARFVQQNGEIKVSDIVSGCDKIYGDLVESFQKNIETNSYDLFSDIEVKIEGIADNPPDDSKFMSGPFPTVNSIYGSLSRPGNLTVIGSRSGVGKTSYGMFHNVYLAERYNIPILHLDFGEMSAEELQFRAVCMFTMGEVPYWALESGKWRQNPEWAIKVRQVWPRIKKIKFYYEDISNKEPKEIISLIRRYSLGVIGRGNQFLIHYDYLKPFNTSDYATPEWKVMGHFIQDIKSFINGEIQLPFWASLQLNRSGITTNKMAVQVDDSENSFSISDKILQQSTHSFILRHKLNEEMTEEGGLKFGNIKMICVKSRHLGHDTAGALKPVEVKKGVFKKNYINILSSSFHFEDKGDLRLMTEQLKLKHDITEDGNIDDSNI